MLIGSGASLPFLLPGAREECATGFSAFLDLLDFLGFCCLEGTLRVDSFFLTLFPWFSWVEEARLFLPEEEEDEDDDDEEEDTVASVMAGIELSPLFSVSA